MTPFIHLYCVIWIELLTGCCTTTGRELPTGQNVVSVAPIEVPDESMYPRFAEPIPNVTVTVGRDALLACVVDNLRGFKVAWVRMDTQTILSIHHNIITQNARISLSYNDHRSWYLHIKNVQEVDRGWYMCQVNTDPMRSRKGYLQVVVPPSIIDNMTSTDMVVREGSDVTLVCRASGYPEPYVMWRREDGQDFNYNGESVSVVDGETLTITKVSRLHMGAYLCIASNGVPPSISKRIMLMVQFPPMLSIPNQLEGAYIGQDVTLECHTEAYPSSINYWTTDRGDMIISEMEIIGGKYEAFPMDSGYNKFMMLKIKNITKEDFGFYKCIAKNSLGETDGIIKLDEIPAPPSAFTTTQKTVLDNQTIRKKGLPQIIQSSDAISSNFQGEMYGEQLSDFDDDLENSASFHQVNSVLGFTLICQVIIIARYILFS
ncbi:lachesin-like isoform X1 [Spodoptera litura]|uniref:Lachesin-like isoform X1 n=1 Tax=Spodoptera litura TaxID=69820 RepID=A0A9J7IV97_SPOLT|nr:lachesin-like isoform X1 [Spodoptera litura]